VPDATAQASPARWSRALTQVNPASPLLRATGGGRFAGEWCRQ